MKRILFCTILLAIAASFLGGVTEKSYAQGANTTIEGLVTDASGAAVSGASVVILNVATGISRTVTSDSAGRYLANSLNPGTYQVTATASGFNERKLTGIVLNVSSDTRVDIALTVGQTTQTVTVQATETMADTETSSNGALIDNKKVVEMPLANRQFYDLALLSPAAYQPAQNSVLGFRGGINVAGVPEVSNQFTLNGIYDNDIGTGQPSFRPSIEDIQEFKLLTGVYSAEYGRMAGGQVVVATKAGGNSFHGVAYEFIRNQVTDAKPYFTQQGGVNPAFKQNTFGATIGGPIRRDKTFFFYSYEGQRIRQQITTLATVPTSAMLAGCFNIPTQMYNPATGTPLSFTTTGACSGVPGGGYDITSIVANGQSMFNSAGAKTGQLLAALGYPAPTYATPTGGIPGNNYNFSETRQETMNENAIRVDHTFSMKNSFFGTYNWFHDTAFEPSNSLCSALVLPNYGCFTGQLSQLASVTETHIFNPKWVNEIRFGWELLNQPRVAQDNTAIGTKFPGLPGAFDGTVAGNLGVPFTQVANYSTFGGAPNLPQNRYDNHWQLFDELTWNHGPHTVKAGLDFFQVKNSSFYVVGGRGQLTFNTQTLQSANCTTTPSGDCVWNGKGTTGYEIGDLLLGLPAQTTNSPTAPKAHNRYESYDLFVLDDWKVTPSLTLNLGLRWELDVPVHDAHDDLSNFSLTAGTFIGAGPTTYTHLYNFDYNNFAPRVGFAFQPLHKDTTVIKGAFGVFYDQPLLYNNFYQFSLQYPQYNTQTFFAGAYPGAAISLSQPFPSALLPTECISESTPASNCSPTIYPYAVNPNYRTPYIQEYSLGIQQALTKTLLFESTFFGSKGTKLPFMTNANQINPNTLGAATAQANRPFHNFQNIYYYNTNGYSNYASWQNSLRQNFNNGVSFLLAYTYGKSLDAGDVLGTYTDASSSTGLPQNSASLQGDYGPSDFDVRHRVVFSPVAQLPFGRDKKFLNSGWAGKLAGGFQVSGIFTYQSGRPFSVFNSSAPNNSGSFSFVDRPNVVGNINGPDPVSGIKTHTPAEWFNIHAFSLAPAGEFGNESRNSIIGPNYIDLDATVSRSFHIAERFSGEFRVEGFNIANHPQFFNPNPGNSGNQFPLSAPGILPSNYSGSFGTISQSNNQRELQFGLRILY